MIPWDQPPDPETNAELNTLGGREGIGYRMREVEELEELEEAKIPSLPPERRKELPTSRKASFLYTWMDAYARGDSKGRNSKRRRVRVVEAGRGVGVRTEDSMGTAM